MRNWHGNLSPFGLWHTAGRDFSPFTLFAGGEEGVWYDPSDLTTLFQDTAGTTPVTTPGQSVALMLDKSKGAPTLGPELVTNGTFDTDTDWDEGTGWTISGGEATHTGASFTNLSQDVGLVAGRYYQATWTQAGGVFIAVYASIGNPSQLLISNTNQDGTYSVVFLNPIAANFGFRSSNGAVVDNVSVRELPGYHATQSTAAARPKYGIVPETGRRNILYSTHDFETSAPSRFLVGVTAENITDDVPSVASEAVRMSETTADGGHSVFYINNLSGQRVLSVYAKAGTRRRVILGSTSSAGVPASEWAVFDLVSGTVVNSAIGSAAIEPDANGWYRLTFTTANSNRWVLAIAQDTDTSPVGYVGETSKNVLFAAPQCEPGSTATAYQRVTTDLDVTEAGVPSLGYLSFDGVDDVLISPSAVFFGEASSMMVGLESFAGSGERTVGTDVTTSGLLVRVGIGTIGFVNSFTVGTGAVSSNSFSSNNRLVSWLRSEPQNSALLRVDGTGVSSETHDQADNNSRQLAIGGNTSRDFGAMNFFSLVHIARFINDAELSSTERYLAQKTGVDLT